MNHKIIGPMILANVLEMKINKYLNYVDRFITSTAAFPFYRTYYIDERILSKCPIDVAGIVVKEEDGFRFYGPENIKLNFELLREPDNLKWKHTVNWIRTKNLFLHHVITTLLNLQRPFLETLDRTKLIPMSLSRFLEEYPFQYLDISRLSRLLNNTWISFRGEKHLLRDLFWNHKKVRAAMVARVVYQQPHRMKDHEIQACLKRDFGIDLSIRTVCHYRNSLQIPAYNKNQLFNLYSNSFSIPLPLQQKSLSRIPKKTGVYEISTKGKIEYPKCSSMVIYYGCSKNLRSRIQSYLSQKINNSVIQHYRECERLFIRHMPTSKYLQVETELLQGFLYRFGSLPAANRNPKTSVQ